MLAGGLLFLLAWSPAWITASLMNRYAVDIPVWDDLERAELLDRYQKGTLDWGFLTSAHIEHRILLPRLIILANARFGDGNIRHEVLVNFAAMLICAAGLAFLIRKTRPGNPLNWFLVFLVNLSVFSLIQYQNLCWAIQTAFFLPLSFLVMVLVVLRSSLRWPVQFVLALLCALGGSLCFAHGLALWPLVAIYFLMTGNRWHLKKRVLIVAGWTLIAVVFGALYFNGITSTSHPAHSYMQSLGEYPPGFSDLVGGKLNWMRVIYAGLLALGSPCCRLILVDPLVVAPWAGGFLLAGFTALSTFAVFRSLRDRSSSDWNNLLPWLALGGYAVVSIFLVSLGRSNFGSARVLSPRYLTISNYLIVACVVLSALLLSRNRAFSSKLRGCVRCAGPLLVGIFLVIQGWNWLYGYRGLQLWNAARWQSLAGYFFREFAPSEHPARLDYTPNYAQEQLDRLVDLGQLRLPPPISKEELSRFRISSHQIDETFGGLIRVSAITNPVRGWLIDGFSDIQKNINRVPDAVLFTTGPERTIIGFAEPAHTPLYYYMQQDFEFSDLNLPNRETRNRWSGTICSDRLPVERQTPLKVTVWAVDLQTFTAYRHTKPFTLYSGEEFRSNYDRPWRRGASGIRYDAR